eukprot:2169321-Rhodomonas_salina.5
MLAVTPMDIQMRFCKCQGSATGGGGGGGAAAAGREGEGGSAGGEEVNTAAISLCPCYALAMRRLVLTRRMVVLAGVG